MAASITLSFSGLPDPRKDRGRQHRLSDILAIAVLSILCGGEDFFDMQDFGDGREEWLKQFLKLPAGIPSHDTFRHVFALLDPEAFETCFRTWTEAVAGEIVGAVALDGKTLRRSFDKASGKAAVQMVSAWASDNGVVFGQIAVPDKGNEITAIPALLKMLHIKGLIITIDAIGCQKAIAKQVVAQGGDYVLAVKANQPALLDDVKETFSWARKTGFKNVEHAETEVTEKGHGRIETRKVTVLWTLSLVRERLAWAALACIAEVKSTRVIGQSTAVEHRYYISSVETRKAVEVARVIRQHWGIENGLHRSLDVTFGEDQSRTRVRHAAQNLARARRMALNLLKLDTGDTKKRSLKSKRFMASLDPKYLFRLLGSAAPTLRDPPQTP